MTQTAPDPISLEDRRTRWRAPVGGLTWLLWGSFGLFALLIVNSVYLVGIRVLGLSTGESYENWFYLTMFLAHLVLGLVIILPIIIFGFLHMRRVHDHPNRRAVKAGYALFIAAIIVLATGLVLVRIEGLIDIRNPGVRSVAWWLHAVVPLLVIWLFILHRLAGRRIKWGIGLSWAGVAFVFAVVMLTMQSQDPRKWNIEGNPAGDQYFFPSLARTMSGNFIPASVLDNDEYCLTCHADVHDSWMHSVHRFSSFNNPVYLASVKQTRDVALERDGNVAASRFCAGCHDPVPFFSGAFNDPDYDMEFDPTAHAGVTCTVCHGITHVNSPRGNADYTIDEPPHYPFTFSDSPLLQWVNQQLVKAKPEFHKKTFLKPLHQTEIFCGTCHKVHLPVELNHYKWLRGQDHQDAFRLSGVSGHGITSFYYPPIAQVNCNTCHMPLMASDDFGSAVRDDSGVLKVHDHMFPSANTAMPRLVDMPRPEEAIAKHREFLEGVMRLDLFAIKPGGTIAGEVLGPLGPDVTPELIPGEEYLIEAVIRTVKMGHTFTQGTADSNQVWMDVQIRCGDEIIGHSGGLDEGVVDPWSHFVNAFVIDRDGNRIDRRNAQDIFTALYNHQIPPGAADVVHYRFIVPNDCAGPITISAELKYRKFDTTLMRFVHGDDAWINDLPITVLASDEVILPLEGEANPSPVRSVSVPEWIRWNDYGIGLFRKGGVGELKGAEAAFKQVEDAGKPDGPINLTRVYLKEGRVTEDAPAALARAAEYPTARQWHMLWFGGQVDRQNGRLDEALAKYQQILDGGFEQAKGRGFDFTEDWRVLNEVGSTLYQRARMARAEAGREERVAYLLEAADMFQASLVLDPEGMAAHYGLMQVLRDLGDAEGAARHEALHAKYKPDDNAKDHAISEARLRYPAGNRGAEAVVIYDLTSPPPGATE
jgi:hypothetical protein